MKEIMRKCAIDQKKKNENKISRTKLKTAANLEDQA
jgi:hypothetical protein